MTLCFLEDMSYFDHTRRQMRFVAHDGTQAVSFRIDLDAFFEEGYDGKHGETDYMTVFTSKLEVIHGAARNAYGHGRRSVYVLSRDDF
ncbi:DUF1488 family protein [Oricola indica]|uniref:DUF1488 family protein n=1 Tax=Oricola indica TaxID=2872591 RepID=UPI003CCBA396